MKSMIRNQVRGVYAITPETAHTAGLVDKVAAALAGGVRLVQYRNKSGSARLRREQCTALLKTVRAFDGALIVNDDCGLAFEVDADGVHLGMDDGSVSDARRSLGADKFIGVSCYNDLDRACTAQAAGADYVAFGSFFPSLTKPAAVGASMDLLSRAKSRLEEPLVAIGCIDKDNAAALVEAGADAVAVLSSLFNADDIEREARALLRAIAEPDVQFQY